MSNQTSGVKKFSDLNARVKRVFRGPRVYPYDILDQPFQAEFCEIRPSKKANVESCLYMQIIIDGKKKLLNSSSNYLLLAAEGLDPDKDFPFMAKIVKIEDSGHFEFRDIDIP